MTTNVTVTTWKYPDDVKALYYVYDLFRQSEEVGGECRIDGDHSQADPLCAILPRSSREVERGPGHRGAGGGVARGPGTTNEKRALEG
jgi:hypothetical protein